MCSLKAGDGGLAIYSSEGLAALCYILYDLPIFNTGRTLNQLAGHQEWCCLWPVCPCYQVHNVPALSASKHSQSSCNFSAKWPAVYRYRWTMFLKPVTDQTPGKQSQKRQSTEELKASDKEYEKKRERKAQAHWRDRWSWLRGTKQQFLCFTDWCQFLTFLNKIQNLVTWKDRPEDVTLAYYLRRHKQVSIHVFSIRLTFLG